MAQNWTLDSLYSGFDSADFKKDLQTFEILIEKNDTLSNTLCTYQDLEQFFHHLATIKEVSVKLFAYAQLSFNADTKNEQALIASNKIRLLLSKLTPANTKLVQFLSTIPNLKSFIAPSPYLNEIEFVLEQYKKSAQHLLSEVEETLLSKLAITGSTAWSTLQSKLSSSLTAPITLDGEEKEMPIASLRNLAFHKDSKVRKAAYHSELEAYAKIDEAVAMALNSIKGEVLTVSEMRGFKSPLEMTLEQSRMSEKTLNAMIGAIKKYIPSFQKYLLNKAMYLGHENGLPFYDLFAPIGEFSKQYTYDEGCQFVLDNFSSFSEPLRQVAEKAMHHQWIDVSPKEGKVSGAFCASIHPLKEFRILLNYTGTLGDVTTLAHELGHGYHSVCTFSENILNTAYPMPLAETASTFCETIVNNAAIAQSSPEEQITILENSLQDATQVICDIYSRYEFESQLFEGRKDHPLSVSELNEMMLDAQKKAYGNGLDHNYLHPYMWLIKPHYYSAALNFYNFPYAFGLLFAKGLYAKYLEDPVFFKATYDELLAASGKMYITDVCKIMNIDVESQEFWEKSLAIIEKDIEKFEKLVKERI